MTSVATVTVWVDDPAALAEWYVAHTGLGILQQTPRFALLGGDGGGAIGFHVGEPLATPERVQFHVEVDDVDAVVERLTARGVVFDEPPTDRPWGVRSATCTDPAGHSVEFTTPFARPDI
jgi:catechol 2,3-dioxygenase-like lactoylglutathione lyase family enzyme